MNESKKITNGEERVEEVKSQLGQTKKEKKKTKERKNNIQKYTRKEGRKKDSNQKKLKVKVEKEKEERKEGENRNIGRRDGGQSRGKMEKEGDTDQELIRAIEKVK